MDKELKNYLDKHFKTFATKSDLKGFATKDDIQDIRKELKKFATKDDLKNFATKDDLKGFATKYDLKNALKGLATKDDIRDAVDELVGMIGETIAEPLQRHFDDHESHQTVATSLVPVKPKDTTFMKAYKSLKHS